MKNIYLTVILLILLFDAQGQNRLSITKTFGTIYFTNNDSNNIHNYEVIINKGLRVVHFFFNDTFHKKFDVFIYNMRADLDAQWQKDWRIPNFKSECWMVASGIATKLDMISPAQWNKEACEHEYRDTLNTQRLITHELVHVYHGQLNSSPDFSDVSGIDWFVEGLATYVSGQCDSQRLDEVKLAVKENKAPQNLDSFWTGKLKYGFSGSLVMFIDKKYGRNKLKQLLPFNNKKQLLNTLNISEDKLISEWKIYMLQLK